MSSMNSIRLRELIRSVRKCSNNSEERALINRHCAIIRNNFKDAAPTERNRYVLMLLYIRMLGYPTEFSQVEVVNLIARPELSGRRIGYLALQILLEENDEVLTLVVNHMKMDFHSTQPMIQAMALNAAANIASEDMARNIVDDLLKLIKDRHVPTRAKAAMAAVRAVRRVPSYAEYFLEQFTNLFHERDPTALLSALVLVNLCLSTPSSPSLVSSSAAATATVATANSDVVPAYVTKYLPVYRKLVAAAARTLKTLVLSARATESDVSGVTDPFLQVKILEFLALVGKDSAVTAEVLHDVLTQVITATDAKHSVGCAIQYACVQTINAIESDTSLRLLAVNTCTRFLAARDNNLRFVGLQVLAQYAREHVDLVHEHQNVIFDCLKDVDVSIRRRALELTVMLVTLHNVRLLVPDLLAYLDFCAEEIEAEVVGHICRILEEKAPSKEWQVEYSLMLLKRGGQHVTVDFTTRLLALLSQQPAEVQTHAVRVLWDDISTGTHTETTIAATSSSRTDHHAASSAKTTTLPLHNISLMIAALWMIGEYADYLLAAPGSGGAAAAAVNIDTIVERVGNLTMQSGAILVKQYGLTALMKIGARFVGIRATVVFFLRMCTTSMNCELQQRACEYVTLLTDFPAEAEFSFARMPAVDQASVNCAPQKANGTRLPTGQSEGADAQRVTAGVRQIADAEDSHTKNDTNYSSGANYNSSAQSKEQQQHRAAIALRDLFGPEESNDDSNHDPYVASSLTRGQDAAGEAGVARNSSAGLPSAASAHTREPHRTLDHLDALFGGAGDSGATPLYGALAKDGQHSHHTPFAHTEDEDGTNAFAAPASGSVTRVEHGPKSTDASFCPLAKDDTETAPQPIWQTSTTRTPAVTDTPPPLLEVYRNDIFSVHLEAHLSERTIDAALTIHSLLRTDNMEQIVLQVAVPRLCTVTMAPLESTMLVAQGTLLQRMQIDTANDPKHARNLVLRVKLSYVVNGMPQEALFHVSHSL